MCRRVLPPGHQLLHIATLQDATSAHMQVNARANAAAACGQCGRSSLDSIHDASTDVQCAVQGKAATPAVGHLNTALAVCWSMISRLMMRLSLRQLHVATRPPFRPPPPSLAPLRPRPHAWGLPADGLVDRWPAHSPGPSLESTRPGTCVTHPSDSPAPGIGDRSDPAAKVQVQVCFTSVCGQVQPLDVALSNSVRHSYAIAVPIGVW
jgi:hypothetical protein